MEPLSGDAMTRLLAIATDAISCFLSFGQKSTSRTACEDLVELAVMRSLRVPRGTIRLVLANLLGFVGDSKAENNHDFNDGLEISTERETFVFATVGI